MATTKVTTQSYGSKLGDSFKGIIGGFFAILLAIGLLWWNEGRAVETAKSLKEGRKNVVAANVDNVSSENSGKLIHVSGLATTTDSLSDTQFGFKKNAIKLKKTVEMYQYKENVEETKKDNMGGSTTTTKTYTYEEVWSSTIINSSNFEENWRQNPSSFIHKSNEWQANNVTLGAFKLSSSLIQKMGGYKDLDISENMLITKNDKHIISGGMIYYSADPQSPQIGDERIKYTVVRPQDVSVIAQQVGNSFQGYQTKAGNSLNMIDLGIKSSDEMFTQAEKANSILTWILRVVGFFLMFAGFSGILKPLSVAGSVLPILGDILGAGASLVSGIISFALSFIIIAIAWIFYRPLLGIAFLAVGIGAIFLAKKYLGKNKATPNVGDV